MNPIGQIWKEIRKRGFLNEIFHTLDKVIDRLCYVIKNLPAGIIQNITNRQWILSIFMMEFSIREAQGAVEQVREGLLCEKVLRIKNWQSGRGNNTRNTAESRKGESKKGSRTLDKPPCEVTSFVFSSSPGTMQVTYPFQRYHKPSVMLMDGF